jgi:peptidoglycan/xylan/chitin deacetylase (PgdA/CDA1 family)
MSGEEIRRELSRAVDLFSQVAGVLPRSSAAPGWQVSFDSLTAQDGLGFDYCSDIRGIKPFYPRMNGVTFRTLQIPSTLPTLDELWGTDGLKNAETVNDKYLDLLEPGLNVHTVHAEMEGGGKSDVFAHFLDCCIEGETEFPTLRDVALRFKNAGPADVELSEIPGRAGKVAVQAESIGPRP